MFDEPDQPEERAPERPTNPADRAREKADEFRMHAELAAVFEGVRKFDAQVYALGPQVARDAQRTVGKLEKARTPDTPLIAESAAADAATLLNLPATKDLSTNDYHICRRPGEVMILRWLAGDHVDAFYERLQAHFDAALAAHVDDERGSHGWKQDLKSQAYLEALEKLEVTMAERYVREPIRKHNVFILSTQTADEMDILHLCDYVMGVPSSEVVGAASALPGHSPTDRDRAWFFKLFSLRGMREGVEQMFFFAYLQKSEEDPGF